jgi:hypothetical protein
MALFSGHVSLLFSRCAFQKPVIEVNEVTKTLHVISSKVPSIVRLVLTSFVQTA